LRRKSGHKVLRSLPEIFSTLGKPFAIHEANRPHVASSALGPGHCRALPTAQGNLKFTFVAVEYFTKWIEARAVSTITSKTAQKFFWQNIVCRFGVPSELTVDNGKQFDSQDFKDFCFSIGTKLAFASVYHPQSNGVVERANGKIFTAVKKMLLDDKKGKWLDLLPEVVWALNTTECRATGFTPFRLLYESEAMTPQEIKHGSPRTVA
jgi:transposase InsO family protein